MNDADLRVKLARVKERMKAIRREAKQAGKSKDTALELATTELHRRLEILNGEAGRLREMQQTYVLRESFDRFKETTDKEGRARADALDSRIKVIENFGSNLMGKLWLPMLMVAAIAASIAAAIVKLVLK